MPRLVSAQEKFDPLTYFVEKAKQQQAAAEKGEVQAPPAAARRAPQPVTPSPTATPSAVWVFVAVACIIAAIALIGWLKPPAWTLAPRIDEEIGKEFTEFVDSYGEEGEHIERIEKAKKKREEAERSIPEEP